MNVLQIYRGAQEVLLTQYRTLFDRSQAPHHATRGALYEQLIRDFFTEYLPQQFYIGTGQVVGSLSALSPEGFPGKVSRQTDVVIFDALHHPILLPKYELFPIEGTLATIEVKSKLRAEKSAGALENIASVKRLGSWARDQPVISDFIEPSLLNKQQAPDCKGLFKGLGIIPMSQEEKAQQENEERHKRQQYNRELDQHFPLGVVLAFETENSPETLLGHWQEWNAQCEWKHRTEMICILKENLLLIDTSRIDQFWDPHQIQHSFWPPDKLIALESKYMFLVFFTLLLRRLRLRSAITPEIIETTPISYFQELPWKIVAQVNVPLSPRQQELRRLLNQSWPSDEEQA
jgi:hypothetical protein